MSRIRATDSRISNPTLAYNALNCLLVCALVYVCCAWTSFPMTIDVIWQLFVTEVSLWRSGRNTMKFDRNINRTEEDESVREKDSDDSINRCQGEVVINSLAAVVGWREDEELFESCLRSYQTAQGCRLLIVGVDGDTAEDMVMVETYERVFSDFPLAIHFERPLGEILESYEQDSMNDFPEQKENSVETNALQMLYQYVENVLDEQMIPRSLQDAHHICIYQPHRSKKDILFSAFVVGLVVGKRLHIDYIWGSDSDTVVFPTTIQKTVRLVHFDDQAGGASARLQMVNKNATIVSKMIAAKYWYDQDVIRKQTAACKASECQPGPCTVFRLTSLRDVIVPWYKQVIFGKRMIANEDRHLTTNLLHSGWRVHYAHDAAVLTDAPSTVLQWIKQQVRWGRGTHIERLERPIIYLKKCPLFFLHILKEEVLPILAGYTILDFLLRGEMRFRVSTTDLAVRIILQFVYTLCRACEPMSLNHILWILPSLLFHSLPGPGIHLWSLFTAFESSWGTKMRGATASQRKEHVRERWYQVGFHVVWMTIIVGFCARTVQKHFETSVGIVLNQWFLPGSMVIAGPLIYWSIFSDLHVKIK